MRRALIALLLAVASRVAADERAVEVAGARLSELKKEYAFIRFSVLAGYDYPMPQPNSPPPQVEIPGQVRALDGKKVSVRGYMVPLEFDKGAVGRFILSASIDACHFGIVGSPNEWILVEIAGGRRTRSAGFDPVTVFGVLSVGAEVKKNRLSSVYRMKADALAFH
jgi:hypothetical protein